MAKNKGLYTVFHSLDDKGAFDRPNPSLQDGPDSVQGKYFQEHTEYPKWVHAQGHKSVIVADAEEEAKATELFAQLDKTKSEIDTIHEINKSALNRSEMLEKAKRLGLKADGRTSDKKLAYLIEEAELLETPQVA